MNGDLKAVSALTVRPESFDKLRTGSVEGRRTSAQISYMSQGCLVVLLLAISIQPAAGQITVTQKNFEVENWLRPTDALRFRVDRLPTPTEGRLAIFIGKTEVTALFRSVGAEFIYDPSLSPLPSGETELILYLAPPSGEWKALANFPLKVLNKYGFKQAQADPRLDLNLKSQLAEGRSTDAGPAERASPYADWTLQGGLQTHHERGDFDIRNTFDVLGVSRQRETLRFRQLGTHAPKIDLSSYLIEARRRGLSFSLGHINYGNNRHLLNSMDSRGLIAKYQLGNRFDLSLNSMNGRQIVGYDNVAGLSDLSDNNISAGTLGMNVLKSANGDVRLEGMLMRGRLQPELDFNVGEVVDAEQNHGFGLRLVGSGLNNRVRGDFSFARSRYDNPHDPQLSMDVNLVEVKKTSENARYFELAFDLLQNYALREKIPVSLTLSGSHERIDPQFRSLGAFTNTNQEINQIAADIAFDAFAAQLRHTWTEDNLDDISTILKTRTRNATINFAIPLPTLLARVGFEKPWVPSLNYGFGWTHQFGANRPTFEEGGFEIGDIPNQLDINHTTGLNWSGQLWNWTFGYQFLHSFQDNRQLERTNADFTNYMHVLSFAVQPLETLNANLEYSWSDAASKETAVTRFTQSSSAGLEWRFWRGLILSGLYSYTDEDDSRKQAISRSYTLETQLAWQFQLPDPLGRRLPGRVFIRHALQSDVAKDRLMLFANDVEVWAVNAGVSLSLF